MHAPSQTQTPRHQDYGDDPLTVRASEKYQEEVTV